jgi:hypothetical protein
VRFELRELKFKIRNLSIEPWNLPPLLKNSILCTPYFELYTLYILFPVGDPSPLHFLVQFLMEVQALQDKLDG